MEREIDAETLARWKALSEQKKRAWKEEVDKMAESNDPVLSEVGKLLQQEGDKE